MELWKEIPGFPGNYASTLGGLRTHWYKVRNTKGRGSHRDLREYPRPIPMTPDDNGYLHCNIYCDIDGLRYTRKVHVLIARTFIPLPPDFDTVDYTVDHISSGPEGKLDNSVKNLQWLSRGDNIRKAYLDGMCDSRIRNSYKPVMVFDTWTAKEFYFNSINEASSELKVHQTSISHSIGKGVLVKKRFIFDYAGGEERLLYDSDEYEAYQRFSWL